MNKKTAVETYQTHINPITLPVIPPGVPTQPIIFVLPNPFTATRATAPEVPASRNWTTGFSRPSVISRTIVEAIRIKLYDTKLMRKIFVRIAIAHKFSCTDRHASVEERLFCTSILLKMFSYKVLCFEIFKIRFCNLCDWLCENIQL